MVRPVFSFASDSPGTAIAHVENLLFSCLPHTVAAIEQQVHNMSHLVNGAV
jgi:hypothetical protein